MAAEPSQVPATQAPTGIRRHVPWLRGVALALAGMAYAWLGYRAASQTAPAAVGVILGFAPLAMLALWLAWRSRRRALLLPLLALAMVLGWTHAGLLLQHYRWAYLLQHVGAMLLLGTLFGHSLMPGREPMVSRFARQLHGTLSPRLRRYTRGVTWAWTAFFASMALFSLVLFALAPARIWALYAELLTPLLVLALFAVEYLVRLRALPPEERAGPIESVLAYARYRAGLAAPGAPAAAPRKRT